MKLFIAVIHGLPLRAFLDQKAAERYVLSSRSAGFTSMIYSELELDDTDDEVLHAQTFGGRSGRPALSHLDSGANVIDFASFRRSPAHE
jgi:hypothetical protein